MRSPAQQSRTVRDNAHSPPCRDRENIAPTGETSARPITTQHTRPHPTHTATHTHTPTHTDTHTHTYTCSTPPRDRHSARYMLAQTEVLGSLHLLNAQYN